MRAIYSFVVLALVVLHGCVSGYYVKVPEENGSIAVHFCTEADCSSLLVSFINSASPYVYCAFYDLGDAEIAKALALKSRHADVKVVMEGSNYKSQLKGNIKVENASALMHNKFCVSEGRVILGSYNPTRSNDYNDLLVISSKSLASNYKSEFEELWSGIYGKGKQVKYASAIVNCTALENYFCPEDSCADMLIKEIGNAKKSIYFALFSFTDENVADALLFNSNAEVKGVFDKRQYSNKYSQYERLNGFGVDVKKSTGKRTLHYKFFVIDNSTVITGSYNPTKSGNTRNDENMLIIHDDKIAAKYTEKFFEVWEK